MLYPIDCLEQRSCCLLVGIVHMWHTGIGSFAGIVVSMPLDSIAGNRLSCRMPLFERQVWVVIPVSGLLMEKDELVLRDILPTEIEH